MMEKYVKGYFALSRLLVSDFLLFNILFWSSIKKFKVPGSQILESWVLGLGSWVPGSRSWVLGPGSWLLGLEFRLLNLDYAYLIIYLNFRGNIQQMNNIQKEDVLNYQKFLKL